LTLHERVDKPVVPISISTPDHPSARLNKHASLLAHKTVPACTAANCAACAANSATTCATCKPGYYLINGQCTVVECAVANCAACAANSGLTCATCNAGYTLKNGQCSSAGGCPAGWSVAVGTLYDSWPKPGTTECVAYSGCTYAGQVNSLSAGSAAPCNAPAKWLSGGFKPANYDCR
jgi:hypothetical protein